MTVFSSKEDSLRYLVNELVRRLSNGYELRDVGLRNRLAGESEKLVEDLLYIWDLNGKELGSGGHFRFRSEIGNYVEEVMYRYLELDNRRKLYRTLNTGEPHGFDCIEILNDREIRLVDIKSSFGQYSRGSTSYLVNRNVIDGYREKARRLGKRFYLYVYMVRKNGMYCVDVFDLRLSGDGLNYFIDFRDFEPEFVLTYEDYVRVLYWIADLSYRVRSEELNRI